MPKQVSKPGKIHARIVEIMKRFPEGLNGGQIRQELEKEGLRPDDQTHLDRRKRDLKKWFIIEKIRTTPTIQGKKRTVVLYKYKGERTGVTDEGQVSQRDRAEVLHAAHGSCQMCGMTIEKHGITLVVDHKKPRDWGGTNAPENLWAICEQCNAGKKAYFSSLRLDAEMMKKVAAYDSVHVRIGELLKAVGVGNRTPSMLLEIVADQGDWQKRLRELRYPIIGWQIETLGYKGASQRKQVDYVLREYKPWPDDPTKAIRQFEHDRRRRNKGQRGLG